MALTPLDIHHKEFKSARFGGYNEEEVDSFLDQVADELEKLIHETEDARGQMEQLKAQVSEFEEMRSSLQNALIAATRSAEVVTDQARQESEAMIAKAQDEADSLIRSAQEQARQMTLRAQNEQQKLERSFDQLKQIKRRYLLSIRETAEVHLAQVAELEARDNAEPAAGESLITSENVTALPETKQVTADESSPVVGPPVILDDLVTAGPSQPETKIVAKPAEPPATAEPRSAEADVENHAQADRHAMGPGDRAESGGAGDARTRLAGGAPPVTGEKKDRPAPASSNLVDEVLAMDNGDDIYAGLENGEGEEQGTGRKGRKQKKDKHFFWE